ncbi:MAG: hypothetical protein HS116_23495 [Planctomycetes bacterium]|nr:hypothetical protein [Planctomycetota bacterium]
MLRLTLLALGLAVWCGGALSAAERVPLRLSLPDGAPPAVPVPVAGGVPFARGTLASADAVRLLQGGQEIPSQITRTAAWPDGSVKWVLVETVLAGNAKDLALEFGAGVTRAAVSDPIAAKLEGADAVVSGGGIAARVNKATPAVLDELSIKGKAIATPEQPVKLVLDTLRTENGSERGGETLPVLNYVCRDPKAQMERGAIVLDEVAVESAGPVRATVLLRGHAAFKRLGATLPAKLRERAETGQLPFSLRLHFYRGTGIVYGEHQIVFAGEPDNDFIANWALVWPGQAGERGTLTLEPGLNLESSAAGLKAPAKQERLCWAPTAAGLGLIRDGWYERPCGIAAREGAAWIEFWPREAGVFDLRRYAREYAVGESYDPRKPEQAKNFGQVAAYGIAKSHRFVMSFDGGDRAAAAQALSGRALLAAAPGWYAKSEALGPFAPEQTSGPFAALDAQTRRELDFHLFCQDLYRWHGKLEYGYWQSRFGQVHRHDRWDNDYGRWGWALNDGAGRIGHILMLEYLRTGERRYFEAGDAFNRVNFDTNMVHTEYHMENAQGWWVAKGSSHRHNVQPFGCPYIGMRGSYPVGQRILHLLTGDGVIADGLEIVSDAAWQYTNGSGSRLCNSGGSDGQGSGANALLWKHETTGEKKYLDACGKMLDTSGLVPPAAGKGLGYGPSFGLFNAAGEYADLAGDDAFKQRVVELGKRGAAEKDSAAFLYAIAMAYRFSKDASLKAKLESTLSELNHARDTSLSALPPAQWPGHAGPRTANLKAGETRDYPYALGVLSAPAGTEWPQAQAFPAAWPARAPKDWYAPGGAQQPNEAAFPAAGLPAPKGANGGSLEAGAAKWTAKAGLADGVDVGGAQPLAAPIQAYVALASAHADDPRLAGNYAEHASKWEALGEGGEGALAAKGAAGPAQVSARMQAVTVDGAPAVRIAVSCQVPAGSGRVAHWGVRVPLKLSGNGHALTVTRPGAFRLERTRLNQNDEQIPSWLAAMEGRENQPHWPLWRRAGLEVGPGNGYRVWHASEDNVAPVCVDSGEGAPNWLDVTDRGAKPAWGVTARLLRGTDFAERQSVRVNLESGLLEIQFHSAAAAPVEEAAAAKGLHGICELSFHDGWRPPLSKPELTAAQYEKFVADLDYGENYGLSANRFGFSNTHKVKGKQWMDKLRDVGIEPREILYSMDRGDGLAKHFEKLGVAYDANDKEGSIRKLLEHYRK